MTIRLSDYPPELIEGRNELEASFIFSLWNEPDSYSDYARLNVNGDETILTEDGKFYFSLGRKLYEQGFRTFDNVTIVAYLENLPSVRKEFESLGGYRTVKELMEITSASNIEGYFDNIAKSNMLLALYDKKFPVLDDLAKLKKMTNQQLYDYYDYQLNTIAINTHHDFEIETLEIDDDFLKECDSGSAKGVAYNRTCRIMNNITMGIPLGELFMIGGYSGTGKTSFVFENMILPIIEEGRKCTIISNEQRSKDFKMLLLAHILTRDLDYWGLTRKKIKQGGFSDEQKDMLEKAKKIALEKYGELRFVKLFDNNMDKVRKIIKKQSKIGHQVFMFDTMKSEDAIDEAMWQQLLLHSRNLFQLASKENVAIICTYQLALHTSNRRFLDASCLSNSKQIKEVFSEMIYFRGIWDDEFPGEKYDIKPYSLQRDDSGKYQKVAKGESIDPEKRYVVAFIDKTRNDEDKQQLLYEFNGRYNIWKEIGYCHVTNSHNW